MKKKDFFVCVLGLLFVLGILIFVLPQNEYSNMEKRKLSDNSSLVLDMNIVKNTENVLKDQFPIRDFFVKEYYNFKSTLTRLFGSSGDGDLNLTYLADDVVEVKDGYYLNAILEYDEELVNTSKSRGYNVQEFANKYPELKTYVYFPLRMEEILSADNNYEPLCLNNFVSQMGPNVSYDTLKINNFEDHKKYFYKTDAHWNCYGAYEGYKDIINMINEDFDIGQVKEIKEEKQYDYGWHGNITSQIGQVGGVDYITDLVLEDIGEYEYYTDGYPNNLNDVKEKYILEGNNTQYSDYDLYFGDNYYSRVFDFHNEDKPNILIFADSYINTNQEWIASHFNKTVIIDLRGRDESFSLDELIKEYNFDACLIMYPYKDMYQNGNMYIPIGE